MRFSFKSLLSLICLLGPSQAKIAAPNPGMIVYINQDSVSNLKHAMIDFLPHFFSVDEKLPDSYSFDFGLGRVLFGLIPPYHVKWDNIKYSNAILDIVGLKI